MTDFGNWNDEFNYLKAAEKTQQETGKQKKSKTWLVAAVSAIVGALIMSVVSPIITPAVNMLIYGTARGSQPFSFESDEQSQAQANIVQVANSGTNRAELSTVDIGKLVGPAVVGITTVVQTQPSFFYQGGTSQGTGSGIIISADGYVVTNNHVVSGAQSVKVTLNTGEEYDATLIGADDKTDLAVIKIKPTQTLTVAAFGDSTILEAGERVVAIGNPLGMEFAGTLTQGIISAVNRTITVDNATYNMIQTDAAINPGNSGGALVNAYGEVIGINSVKVSSSEVEGLGFAIPISEAKPIIEDLINVGYVKGRPLIGLSLRYVTEQEAIYYNFACAGLYVVEVTSGSGAEKAGIIRGDIILSCDGQNIKSVDELNAIRDKHKAGDTITLHINREGKEMDVRVTLTENNTSAVKR